MSRPWDFTREIDHSIWACSDISLRLHLWAVTFHHPTLYDRLLAADLCDADIRAALEKKP